MRGKGIRKGALWVLSLVGAATTGLVVLVPLVAPTSAAAAPLPPFTKFCPEGSAAGQCSLPRGVATSPSSGNLYVANQLNRRIDEFTPWGEFVKAWGWGVKDGSSALQVCTAGTGCQAGSTGSGPGQLGSGSPQGIAADSSGNVYVVDHGNSRVQKFDSEGNFLLMFGGGVNQGPSNPGDVCTAQHIVEGDTCGAGTTGTASGQFSSSWSFSSYIAISPSDEIYVGDKDRIQVFDAEGVYQRQLPIPLPGVVGELAVDPLSGDLYMGYLNGYQESEKTLPNVYRLDHVTGEVKDTLEVFKPAALATNALGEVFVFDQRRFGGDSDPNNHSSRVLRFDLDGSLLEKIAEVPIFEAEEIRLSTGLAASSVCFNGENLGLYLTSLETGQVHVGAYGPTPDPLKCPPPEVPPSINAQFASSVDTESAILQAEINPHYFTDPLGKTTYRVQWGTAACIESGGYEASCVKEQPIPAASLISPPVNVDVTTKGILLSGLAPDTAYRYRFVAERFVGKSEAPAEEAVIGVDGEPGIPGGDAAFTTMPEPSAVPPCANDSLRLGAAANLHDCRAYELVSPLDKAGGDVQARLNLVPFEARMDQASVSGEALTYSSYRAFGSTVSAPFSSQYLAERDPSIGWLSESISPPQEGETFLNEAAAVDNLFRAFTADLGYAWLQTFSEPVLGEGGLAGHLNLYRRGNVTSTYGGCTTLVPQLKQSPHGPQLQGFSADGSLAVFHVENKLTDDASGKLRENGSPIYQLYACSYEGGVANLRLASALPNGAASEGENTAGGPTNEPFQSDQGRTQSLENAVSADGTKVFWTAAAFGDVGAQLPGALYLRRNPGEEQTLSGACDEPGKACTELIDAGPARFWLAAEDGSLAIYANNSDELREYDTATEEATPIAGEILGVLGASEDAQRVYYLSEEQIGGEGEADEPNLYLHDAEAETETFIGTLSEDDALQGNAMPSPGNYEPAYHTARVTPDGQAVAFMSNDPELAEEVAGYDNTDQVGGIPAAEIYRYAVGEGLVCVSCNRTGQRPVGRDVQNERITSLPLYAAALLPPWLNSLYAPRVLSEDGNRIFFEAFEPLVLNDTNGKADVYQWEAFGSGTCTDKDASAYIAQSNGCLSLISSGKATTDSQFVDASPEGDDVFIRTGSSLVNWDPGQIDIYDARVGGGFPPPPMPPVECESEACQSPRPAPEDPTPASGAFRGAGNLASKPRKPRRCGPAKRRVRKGGKTRCVRKAKRIQRRTAR